MVKQSICKAAKILLKRGVIIVITLLAMPCLLRAQTAQKYLDELKSCKTMADSADNYAWAAMCAVSEYGTDNGINYAYKALQLGEKCGDHNRKASAYFALSNIFFSVEAADSSKIYALKAIEQYDRAGKKGVYYTYALNNVAGYYLNNGNAREALNYAFRQLEVANELKDSLSMSNSYTMLSAIYEMMENIEESIVYSKKALDINERIGNVFNRSVVLANLGGLYMSAGKHSEALPYIQQAIYYSTEGDNAPKNQTTAYTLAGECHNRLHRYDSALHYLAKAEQLIEHIDAPQDRVKLLMIYGSTFGALHRYKEGIKSLDKAIEIAKDKKLVKLYSRACKDRANLSVEEGDFRTAYYSLKAHTETEDSLSGFAVQQAIAELKEKYESEKKDARIARQKYDNRLLTGGLIITALLAGLILVQYFRQRAATATIKKQSHKLTMLMKELHHRVKNNLQIISSLLSLQSFRMKDTAASKAVREGQQRIEAMSMIHQRLYTNDNITEINIREFIGDLLDSLQSAYGFGKNDIAVFLDIDDEMMNVDQAIPLSLIVNELVTNAFKYAYEDNAQPELSISLKRKDDNLELMVADNGRGLNVEEWKYNEGSFGKELIRTFIKQLNGYLSLIVDNGTRFTVVIPSII